MNCFIPTAVNVDQLITNRPPIEIGRFNKDHLVYILHLLTAIPATNKNLELKDGFVPIKAIALQGKIKNYRCYLTYLIKTGVIACDNHYVKGEKCKGYKFTARYSGPGHFVKLDNETLAKKLLKQKPYSKAILKEYGHLIRWFDAGLQIRYDLAREFITEDLERKLHNPELLDQDRRTGKSKDAILQYNSQLFNIEKIAARAFPISIDNKGFRFHSVLSNLRSSLRNCLIYNDLEMVSIDICNSQPYLITVLLSSSFWIREGITDALHMDDISLSIDRVFSSSALLSSFIMLAKKGEMQADSGFQAYKELVRNGGFYEHMARLMQKELGINYVDRNLLKAMMFQILFTDNRYIGQGDAKPKRMFRKLFPGVYDQLSRIKQKDKRNLPLLLQQVESHMVLKVITRRIAREKPLMPLFTIHDSIITTAGNESYVQRIMLEEMERTIGVPPRLRIERWAPENLRFGDGTPFMLSQKAAA